MKWKIRQAKDADTAAITALTRAAFEGKPYADGTEANLAERLGEAGARAPPPPPLQMLRPGWLGEAPPQPLPQHLCHYSLRYLRYWTSSGLLEQLRPEREQFSLRYFSCFPLLLREVVPVRSLMDDLWGLQCRC